MKKHDKLSRREFVITSVVGTLGIASGFTLVNTPPVVSVVKIKDDNIALAVEEAIELLGGIDEVTRDKQRIMLKPNLVSSDPRCTTNPEVVRALAMLMKDAGKEVWIGEGSAAAPGFNADEQGIYFSKDPGILDPMQQYVFDQLEIIRIYSKVPGKEPDLETPYVMKKGSTLEEFAGKIHQDFLENLKNARVWGSSAFDGQMVQRDYVLQDEDIVELRT